MSSHAITTTHTSRSTETAHGLAAGVTRPFRAAGQAVGAVGSRAADVVRPDQQDGKPVDTVYIGVASPAGTKALGRSVCEATVLRVLAKLREALVEEVDGCGQGQAGTVRKTRVNSRGSHHVQTKPLG
jgi:hypothetical protein